MADKVVTTSTPTVAEKAGASAYVGKTAKANPGSAKVQEKVGSDARNVNYYKGISAYKASHPGTKYNKYETFKYDDSIRGAVDRDREYGKLQEAIDYRNSGQTNRQSTSEWMAIANDNAKNATDENIRGYWLGLANDFGELYKWDSQAAREANNTQIDEINTKINNLENQARAASDVVTYWDMADGSKPSTSRVDYLNWQLKQLNFQKAALEADNQAIDQSLFDTFITPEEREAIEALRGGKYGNVNKINLGNTFGKLIGKDNVVTGNGRDKEADLALAKGFYDRIGQPMPEYFNASEAHVGNIAGSVEGIVGDLIKSAGLSEATANRQADVLLGNEEATGYDKALGILSGGHYALQGLVAKGRDKLLGTSGDSQLGALNRPEQGSIDELWSAYNNATDPAQKQQILDTLNAGYASWTKNAGIIQGQIYEDSAWLENFSKATTSANSPEEVAELEREYRERQTRLRQNKKDVEEARAIAEKYKGNDPSYWYALRNGTTEDRADALLQLGYELGDDANRKVQGAINSTDSAILKRALQVEHTMIEMGFDAAVAGITGGGGATSKFMMGLRVLGGTGGEALRKTDNPSQATLYGYAKATAEIITETMFEFAGGAIYGKAFTGNLAADLARRLSTNPVFREWFIKVAGVVGEASEEGMSDLLGIPIEMIIDYNKEQSFWDNLKRLGNQELASFWEDCLMGGLVALLGMPIGDFTGSYKAEVGETYNADIARDEEIQGKIEDEREARLRNTEKIQGDKFDPTKINEMMDEKAMEAYKNQSRASTIAQKVSVLNYRLSRNQEISPEEMLTKEELRIAEASGWIDRADRAKYSAEGASPSIKDKLANSTGKVISKIGKGSKFKGENRHQTLTGRYAENMEEADYGENIDSDKAYEELMGLTPEETDAIKDAASWEDAHSEDQTVRGGDAAGFEDNGSAEQSTGQTEADRKPQKLPDTPESAQSEAERILREMEDNDNHIGEDGRPRGDGGVYYSRSRNKASLKHLWEEEQKRKADGKRVSRDSEFEIYTDKDGNKLTLEEAYKAEERGEKVNRWRVITKGVINSMRQATPEAPIILGKKWRDHMTAFLYDGTRLRIVHADGWLGRFSVIDDVTLSAGDFEQAAVYLTQAYSPVAKGVSGYRADSKYLKLFRGYNPNGQKAPVSGPTEVQQGNQADGQTGLESGERKTGVFEPRGTGKNQFVDSKYASRAPVFIGPDARELSAYWERSANYVERIYGGKVYSERELLFVATKAALELRKSFEDGFGAPITYFGGFGKMPFWGFALHNQPNVGTFVDIDDPMLANTVFHENSHRQWSLRGEGISRREVVGKALVDAKVSKTDAQDLVNEVLIAWGDTYVGGGAYTPDLWRALSDEERLKILNNHPNKDELIEALYEEIANIITTEDAEFLDSRPSLKKAVPVFRKALIDNGIYTQEEMDLALNAVANYTGTPVSKFHKKLSEFRQKNRPDDSNVKPIAEFDPKIGTAFYSVKNPQDQREKKLIAVRNTSIENAIRFFKEGGVPMPSIAIVKATHGHESFGPVSFIYWKESLDPEKDAKNRIYGADAWAPVHPDVTERFTSFEPVKEKIFNPLKKVSEKFGIQFKEPKFSFDKSIYNTYGTKEGLKSVLSSGYRAAVNAAILDEQGITLDDVLDVYGGQIYSAEIVPRIFLDKSQQNVVIPGKDGWQTVFELLGMFGSINKNKIETSVSKLTKNQKDYIIDKLAEELRKDGKSEFADQLDWYKRDVYLEEHFIAETFVIAARIPFGGDAFTGYFANYAPVSKEEQYQWIKSNVASITEDVQREYDDFAYSDKEVNNENSLEMMLGMPSRRTGEYYGIEAVHPLLAKSFNSLSEVKANEDLLSDESGPLAKIKSRSKYNEAKNAYEEAIGAIIGYDWKFDDDSAEDLLQDMAHEVADVIDYGIVSDKSLDRIDGIVRTVVFNTMWKEADELRLKGETEEAGKEQISNLHDVIEKVSNAFQLISNLPTGYFEAKPQKISTPSDVGAIIIPHAKTNAEKAQLAELKKLAEDAGVKVFEEKGGLVENPLTGEILKDEPRLTRADIMANSLPEFMFNMKTDPHTPGVKKQSQDVNRDRATKGENRTVESVAKSMDEVLGTGDQTFISKTNEARSDTARKLTATKEAMAEQFDRLITKEKGTWTDDDIVIAQKLMGDYLKDIRDYQLNKPFKVKPSAFREITQRYNALSLRHTSEKSIPGQKLQAKYMWSDTEEILNRGAHMFLGFTKDGRFAGKAPNATNARIYAGMEDAANRIDKAVEEKNAIALAQICKDISDIRGVKKMFGPAYEFVSNFENEILNSIAQQENGVEALRTLALGNLNAICDDVQPYKHLNAAKTIRIMNMLSNMSTIVNNVTNNIASGLTSTNALSQWASDRAANAFRNITGEPVLAKSAKGWLANKEIRNAEWEALKMATLVQMYGVNQEGGKLELSGDKGLFNPNANMFEQTFALYKFFVGMGVEATDQVKSAGLTKAMNTGIDKMLASGKITEAQAEEMRREARHEVDRLLYKDDSKFANTVQYIRDRLNDIKTWGNDDIGTIGLGDIAMAFAKVPANVVRARLLATPEGCLYQVSRYARGVQKAKRMHSEVLARQIAEKYAGELSALNEEIQKAYELDWKMVGKEEKQAKIDSIKSKIQAINSKCWAEAREKCRGSVYSKLAKERDNYHQGLSFADAVNRCGFDTAKEMSQFEMAQYSRSIGKAAISAGMIVLGAVLRAFGALRDFDNEPDEELRKMYAQKGYTGLMLNLSTIGRKDKEWHDDDNIVSAEFLEVIALPLAIGACAADSAAIAEKGDKAESFLKELGIGGLGKAFEAAEDIPGMADAIGFYNAFNNQFNSDKAASGSKLWNSVVTYAAGSIPSFFIPNAFTQATAGLDNTVRDVYNTDNVYQQAWNIVKNKGGLAIRKTIPASIDMWGNERKYGENTFWGFVNKTILPGDVMKFRVSKYEQEVIRLSKEGYKGAVPKIAVNGSFEVGDETYTLTAEEKRDFKERRNKEQAEAYKAFIDSKYYDSLTDEQKVAVLKDLKTECERDARQAMLKDRCLDDVEVTRSKWETELELNEQIQYLSTKQKAAMYWDKSENSVSDFAGMDAFIKNDYNALSKEQKDILNGSYAHLDDLADAAKNGINSEKWQAAYNIYQTFTAKDENGKSIYESSLENASKMWSQIQRATGFSDSGKEMRYLEDHMKLTFTGSPNTQTYDELVYDYGLSRESASKIYKNQSTLQPTKGYANVQDHQKWVGLTQCGLSDKEQWDSWFAMVSSNNTKQIANMTKLRGQVNPQTGKLYTFAEAIHKLKLDVIYWKEVLPNGKEKKHEIK